METPHLSVDIDELSQTGTSALNNATQEVRPLLF